MNAVLQLAAGVAQVSCMQHHLQNEVNIVPLGQLRLGSLLLGEGLHQLEMLGHVCGQHCVDDQPPHLQDGSEVGG